MNKANLILFLGGIFLVSACGQTTDGPQPALSTYSGDPSALPPPPQLDTQAEEDNSEEDDSQSEASASGPEGEDGGSSSLGGDQAQGAAAPPAQGPAVEPPVDAASGGAPENSGDRPFSSQVARPNGLVGFGEDSDEDSNEDLGAQASGPDSSPDGLAPDQSQVGLVGTYQLESPLPMVFEPESASLIGNRASYSYTWSFDSQGTKVLWSVELSCLVDGEEVSSATVELDVAWASLKSDESSASFITLESAGANNPFSIEFVDGQGQPGSAEIPCGISFGEGEALTVFKEVDGSLLWVFYQPVNPQEPLGPWTKNVRGRLVRVN